MTGRLPRTQTGFLDHPLTVALIAGSAFGLLGFMTGAGTQTEKVAQLEAKYDAIIERLNKIEAAAQVQAVDVAVLKARGTGG